MSENKEVLLPKENACNGCQSLNFGKRLCTNPTCRTKALNSYTNADGYIAIIRPADCKSYTPREKKKKNQISSEGGE